MRIYTVRFKFFGYRAQCTFVAKDVEAAKEYIRNEIVFERIIPKMEVTDEEAEQNNIWFGLQNPRVETNETK